MKRGPRSARVELLKTSGALPRDFYARDVRLVARELLNKLLICEVGGLCVGRIVETEAYLPQGDSACHGARGKTPRNTVMFGPPGYAYVYAIHSRWCLNTVTEPEGVACAVLIRAVEPLDGLDLMRSRRSQDDVRLLTRGPGRLCQAFAVDRGLNGHDLTLARRLWIADDETPPPEGPELATTRRIGVTSAERLLLRYCCAGNRFVSGPRHSSVAE